MMIQFHQFILRVRLIVKIRLLLTSQSNYQKIVLSNNQQISKEMKKENANETILKFPELIHARDMFLDRIEEMPLNLSRSNYYLTLLHQIHEEKTILLLRLTQKLQEMLKLKRSIHPQKLSYLLEKIEMNKWMIISSSM